ncbi:MAG: phosphatidate cytidylyltransferase, partial [Clostridia bacterium]|nr:phosphatidate cytidylyltransferase [Clostridia bacterium]
KTFGTVPGVALITMAFGIAYGTDSAAYFGGRFLGKRKLCPAVSPKKTVEGALFGLLGGVFIALAVRHFFVFIVNWPMPRNSATIVLGLIGSFIGQIGDLTASLLKRHSGIKDYGKVFPGHGGVMDRFDSTIFVLIVMYCYTLLLK